MYNNKLAWAVINSQQDLNDGNFYKSMANCRKYCQKTSLAYFKTLKSKTALPFLTTSGNVCTFTFDNLPIIQATIITY